MMKVCPTCGAEFKPKHVGRKTNYCSRKCARRHAYLTKEKIYIEREFRCHICGILFTEKSKRNRKYCGLKCEYKAHLMSQRKNINDEEVKRLYLSGESMTTIASQVGCSDFGIRRRLIKLNVPLRDRLRENSPTWKGGRRITKNGYVEIINPEYRGNSRHARNYYLGEHRLVWEQHNGCKLPIGHLVHHLNGIKTDNRPENLVAMPRKIHSPSTITEPYKQRIRELEVKIEQYENNERFALVSNG